MTQGRTSSDDGKSVLWQGFEWLLPKQNLFFNMQGGDTSGQPPKKKPTPSPLLVCRFRKKDGTPQTKRSRGGVLDWRMLPLKETNGKPPALTETQYIGPKHT